MLEKIVDLIAKEVERSITPTVNGIKKNIMFFALKIACMVLGLAALIGGVTLLGAKYVGLDLMLLSVGVMLVLAFLILK